MKEVKKMYKYKPNECPQGCPKCGKGVDREYMEFIGDELIIDWCCYDCDFEWTETYKFKMWETKEEK